MMVVVVVVDGDVEGLGMTCHPQYRKDHNEWWKVGSCLEGLDPLVGWLGFGLELGQHQFVVVMMEPNRLLLPMGYNHPSPGSRDSKRIGARFARCAIRKVIRVGCVRMRHWRGYW